MIVIRCFLERREDRFDRAGMVAWLEKVHQGVEDVLEGDVEAGEDTHDHYIMCVGGELEERLPRSKDFACSASSKKRRIEHTLLMAIAPRRSR